MFFLLLHVFDSLVSSIMLFILILFVVPSVLLLFFEVFFDAMISFVPCSNYRIDFLLLFFILSSQISFHRFILFLRSSICWMSNPFNWRKRCLHTNLCNNLFLIFFFLDGFIKPFTSGLRSQLFQRTVFNDHQFLVVTQRMYFKLLLTGRRRLNTGFFDGNLM